MILTKKKDGITSIPLLGMFLVLMILMVVIYVTYQESQRISQRTDDAVTVSIQGVCLFDRYEYATGSMSGKEILCFYPGDDSIRYSPDNDLENMEVTQSACAFAYDRFISVLLSNVSRSYVVLPPAAAGGLASYVKKFQITNVYDDTAYIYDIISGTTEIISPATGYKSILTVEMDMKLLFPFYGETNVKFEETGKLESRIN
jgi:hypothetical protein